MKVPDRVLAAGFSAVVGAVSLVWVWGAIGPRNAVFAFLAVWIPMACFALVGAQVSGRVPDKVFAQRSWERGGRVYERLGVLLAKRALRRGPLHVFARSMHLPPTEPTQADVQALAGTMREAETTHGVMFLVTAGAAAAVATRGWWDTAAWMTLFNVVVNGYPVLLQRYNRILLRRRFPGWLSA